MRRSGQAVIRLSLRSLRVAPCLPASTEDTVGGLVQKDAEPCSADIQGQRALSAVTQLPGRPRRVRLRREHSPLASLPLNLFSAKEKFVGGALLSEKYENRKP